VKDDLSTQLTLLRERRGYGSSRGTEEAKLSLSRKQILEIMLLYKNEFK